MRIETLRVFAVAACLLALAGCASSPEFKLSSLMPGADEAPPPPPAGSEITGSTPASAEPNFAVKDALLGGDPGDDLSLGKRHSREQNYGLAEKHFRRAVEKLPRDGEAWLGLAASYDRLRRYDFADRAYDQAIKISGPTAELLNNWGYSFMLRGDYRRARETLMRAQALDPSNPYIKNNLDLLEASYRKGKAIQ
jgi:Flp pilus assembly protein TadD